MKNIFKTIFVTLVLCMVSVNITFASQWNWNIVPGHHDQSILLEENINVAEDSYYQYGRGDYLAEGSVRISDMEDGTLEVRAMTLAHVNVDLIMHTVFLDIWDDDRNDWINLEYWDFVKTKDEVENEELSMFVTTFIVTGCEVGKYYRLRGLHGVELYDELEACATETDGVQLTDWRDW